MKSYTIVFYDEYSGNVELQVQATNSEQAEELASRLCKDGETFYILELQCTPTN